MTRRRTRRFCEDCGLNAPRARRNAKWCTPCYSKRGRPKVTCSVCSEEFAKDVVMGRRCRPCVSKANHEKRVQETYGLADGDYDRLLAAQDGMCAICHRKPGAKRLAVDHNHETDEVRGLLCKACNRDVLGHLRDDTEALQRAIEYLTDPPARRVLAREE